MSIAPAFSLWSELDNAYEEIQATRSQSAVWALVQLLATHRERCDVSAWKSFCDDVRDRPLVRLLTEDPYTRDARTKPAGYPGDARTLDYVYLQDYGTQAVSDAGRQLFRTTTGVPIAEAVRERARMLADILSTAADARSESPRVTSIACGHFRELDHLPGQTLRRLVVWGLDQDSVSVAHCRSRFRESDVTVRQGSIRDVLTGRARLPTSDVVYASGLFDYLDDRIAGLLLRRMVSALAPGGVVCLPNLTPHNDEIAYMEAIMDWWMRYRTEEDLLRIAATVGVDDLGVETRSSTSPGGRVAWLHLVRR